MKNTGMNIPHSRFTLFIKKFPKKIVTNFKIFDQKTR